MKKKIRFMKVGFLLGFFLVAARAQSADRIHHDALIFDAHIHLFNRVFYHGGSLGDHLEGGQVDFPRLREGDVDAVFGTLFVTEEYYPARYETRQTLRLIDTALRQIEENPGYAELALTASDVERIAAKGKIAVVLDLEGGFDLNGDPAVLRGLYRLGLRVVQLSAHNWTTEFADACCSPPKWGGLNDRGRELIREMNRLGIVINVSHASDQALEQAIEISEDPVVATHHGLRSFNDIPRNMPEELLKKLAAKGGLIGFHIGNSFHNRPYFEWRTEHTGKVFWDVSSIGGDLAKLPIEKIDALVAPQFPMVGPTPPDDLRMTPQQWVGVVDKAIRIVGEDHVALGTDFGGGPTPPVGIQDVSDLVLITRAMVERGYSPERIRKFLGGNLLRVFRQVTEE